MQIESVEYIFRTILWLAVYVTAPILIITFVAAIIIGVVQATMQIQEQTLSFAPKLIIIALILALTATSIFYKIVETIVDVMEATPGMF